MSRRARLDGRRLQDGALRVRPGAGTTRDPFGWRGGERIYYVEAAIGENVGRIREATCTPELVCTPSTGTALADLEAPGLQSSPSLPDHGLELYYLRQAQNVSVARRPRLDADFVALTTPVFEGDLSVQGASVLAGGTVMYLAVDADGGGLDFLRATRACE